MKLKVVTGTVLVLAVAFFSLELPRVSASAILFLPRYLSTPSNETFVLPFKMRFDEPDEGFFALAFYWDNNETDPNGKYWNFTYESFVAKFADGTGFTVPVTATVIKAIPEGYPAGYYRYIVSIGTAGEKGEGKNGDFWVNATMRAAGLMNGIYTPHAIGDQDITIRIVVSETYRTREGVCTVHVTAPPLPPPEIAANVDINPDTLNLKSKGKWITCYIELPEGYNVSNIDRSTILLNDTIPVDPFWVNKTLESVIGDYDNDSVTDLMVKFNRTQVIDMMTVGNQTIKITGQLADGTPFEGTDTIRAMHAQITLTDVHTVHLNVTGAFLQGENLKVKFYSYSGAFQGETTVWNGTTPTQIDLSLDLSQNSPIENAIFILADNEENTILNLVNFVVHRSDLFNKITQILMGWPLTPSAERIQFFKELLGISKQWPYAPQ